MKQILSTVLAFSLVFYLTFMSSAVNAQENITDEELLELFNGLRLTDVCDALDIIGLPESGVMDTRIEPLWRDLEGFSHLIAGIAVTARYVPTNKIIEYPMTKEEFHKMENEWYSDISSEPFVEYIKKGTVIVLDVQGDGDVGSVGSLNSLFWKSKGAVGVVANGGIRDTDEIIKEKIPVYFDHKERGRRIRPGRNEIESFNQPVSVGGVLVRAGDVIVADGDGVVVVPREYAKEVASYARDILETDKQKRLDLYKSLGLPLDRTVEVKK